ncbi:ABC transporter substrate-binding protein [Blautia sp. HCP3S3_H10_1]|uniref:ABC transporter substrate-binding protein n=1 Tax=unclassified Blautia TaxID=2648079 RepID=UPI003F92F094|nr:ABC transporter substrate-binding protein [Clostridia bacterium]
MKKKAISTLLAMVMTAGLFAGNASAAYAEGQSSGDYEYQDLEDTEITYFSFSVEGKELYEKEIAAYNEVHPNVKINLELVGGGTDWRSTLKAEISSGQAPDIILLEGASDFETFGDMLEDLSNQPWVEHVYENSINDCKIGDSIVALPAGVVCYGLLYNKAVFDACGIDGSTLKSYDDIDAAFGKVQDAIDAGDLADEFPDLEAVVSLPAAETWVLANHGANPALQAELGTAFDTYEAKSVDFTYADALKDYIDLMVKYSPDADKPEALVGVDYDSAMGGSFCIGRTAVIQMGQWVAPVIEEIDPELLDNIGVLPMPLKGVDEDNICYGIASYMAVNKDADDAKKAAAKDFMNWLFMSDEGKALVTSNISVPMDNFDDFPSANVISLACEPYAKEGNTFSLVFGGYPDGWYDLFGAGIQSYIAGDKDWDTVIEEAKTNWAEMR